MKEVSFAVGVELPGRRPVLLVFQEKGTGHKAVTTWTVEDAEVMAHALLRNAERARRYMAEHPPKIKMPTG